MLFNSFEFLFLFLPTVLAGLYLLSYSGRTRLAVWWAALGSLAFYAIGATESHFFAVLLVSVVSNYVIGHAIMSGRGSRHGTFLLVLGVVLNLMALGYFKYTNFLLDTIAPGWSKSIGQIALPIGISFFTFTQIAFLVDARRGEARRSSFGDYLLFVTFFPHLVAGPILNHRSVIPQLDTPDFGRPSAATIYAALMFFSVGLFKKVIIADSLAPFVAPLFAPGAALSFHEAWAAALLYAFQLYYDFSGYSEMAVGLGLLLNVRIPINFDSPYKATSLIDFWRRWHISLSHFLRDYLYIPLGGSRRGRPRRYVNVLLTMLIGGIWHGAGWTFVIWGAIHGAALAINHAWRDLGFRMPASLGWLVTWVLVLFAWVFFRAPDLATAMNISATMLGLKGIPSWEVVLVPTRYLGNPAATAAWIAGLSVWVLIAPNTQQIVLTPTPRPALAAALATVFVATVLSLDRVTEFLYFRF